ncbi:unnamed protein product, partial [Rotaria socialis]
QLIQKINILGTYCNSLENVVTVVRKSQRLIQIKEIIDYPRRSVYTNETEVARRIISYDGIEKERGKLCDIRLISHDHVDNDIIDAIQNRKEIALIKDENQFTVLYQEKEKGSLGSWKIENHELSNYLSSLNYNRTILDRNECSKIYVTIYEHVTINSGYIRSNFSVFLKNLTNNSKYEITFNDLTVRQDSGTVDEAENIIYQAVSGHVPFGAPILNGKDKYISVSITQINAERLKAFLNPNIEIKEATLDLALVQLEGKSSFFHRHLLPENWSLDLCPVNLEIFLDNNKIEMKSNLQARDAIEILKKRQPDENIQCNLTFISANEISKVLKENVLSNSIQTIEFIGLDGYNVKEKLKTIQSNSITLEISDSKEKLVEILTCLDLQYVELYSYDKEKSNHRSIREVVDTVTAERKIKNYEKDNTTIRLIDILIHDIEEIIGKCPNTTYNISFVRIRNFDELLKGLNNELVNIHFDELELEPAIQLIRQIRKENLDFSLTCKKLTKGQAERLMKEAPVEQENIEINKVKSLNELFMNESRPHLELSEFSGRGIEYLLEISEKRFIPWRSIATVVTIAAVQMTVGGILIATGFGATVGLGLITEGGADLFTAYRAYSTRQFSWSDYGKQKAVSLIISAVSMGFSAIKDTGKGIQNLVTGVGEEVLEQAGTKIITDGKAVSQVLVTTGKNLKSLAIKQIGVTIGENALREGLTTVADFSSHFVLEQLKPQVSAMIQSKVSDQFSNKPKLLNIIRKMYAIESFDKQQKFKDKINKCIAEIINPEHNFWRKQWDSIGGPLCKGLLSSSQHVGGPFSMGMRIVGTLHGMYQITFIIDKVHDQLLEKLSQIDQDTLSIDQILRRYCGVTKEDTYGIVNLLEKQGILDTNKEFNIENLIPTDLSISDMYRDEVVNFLKSLDSVEFNDLSELMKSISDLITEQVFRITESQLISPWSSYGMGELTKAISERVQHHFIVDEKQNADSQNREDREKGESKYNTITKQIKYNAKDYTIAYSQCEIIHYSQQQQRDRSNPGVIDNKTKEYIDGVRNDKPANLSDMMAIAAQNDVDIKIVDDVNYQPTDEDQARGTNIIVYSKGEKDDQGNFSVGHFQLMTGDGTLVDIPSEKNNCGYSVIQKILNDRSIDKSIDDLRNDRAQRIEDNPKEFSKILEVEQWVSSRYPQEANSFLIVGGVEQKKSPEEIKKIVQKGLIGPYGLLCDELPGRQGIAEINHIPPKSAYKGTPYEKININHMPAIAMFKKDHKQTSSWGYYKKGLYQKEIQNLMKIGNMAEAIYIEMKDISTINATGMNYQRHVPKYIDYLASTPVKNAPLNSVGTRTLITPNEASKLKQRLRLR